MGQHATAIFFRLERNAANVTPEYAVNFRTLIHLVMTSQIFIHHREIGIDEVQDAEIFAQQFAKERIRLGHHVVL